jgi:hypothetical protein
MLNQLPYDIVYYFISFISFEDDVISLMTVNKNFYCVICQIFERSKSDSIVVKKIKLRRNIGQLKQIIKFPEEYYLPPSVPISLLINSKVGFSHKSKLFFLKIGNSTFYELFKTDQDFDLWYHEDHTTQDRFTITYIPSPFTHIHEIEVNFLPEFKTTFNKSEAPFILTQMMNGTFDFDNS